MNVFDWLAAAMNSPFWLPRPTQPSILSRSVNEDQVKRQVWFIPSTDEHKCAGKTEIP